MAAPPIPQSPNNLNVDGQLPTDILQHIHKNGGVEITEFSNPNDHTLWIGDRVFEFSSRSEAHAAFSYIHTTHNNLAGVALPREQWSGWHEVTLPRADNFT